MSPSGEDPVACQLCVGRSPSGVSGKVHCQTPSNLPGRPTSASLIEEEGIWPKPSEPRITRPTQLRQIRASWRMTSSLGTAFEQCVSASQRQLCHRVETGIFRGEATRHLFTNGA